jgi:hypothetical protein
MKGRKTRYTKKDKQRLLDELRKSLGIITTACRKCDIGRETFYRWYNEEQWFHDEYETILEEQIEFVENKLVECINDKDHTAIIFYLKTKGRKKGWREINDINIQTDNIKIEFGNAELNENKEDDNIQIDKSK